MIATIVSGGFKAVVWGFALIGLAALALAGMIATPVRRPPELTSISKTAGAVDRSTMPGLERFHARDGTELGLPALSGPCAGDRADRHRRARLVGIERRTIHALSAALAARGVETYAPDIRGHGASGTRGDIGYVGQLEDDLADFVAMIRKTNRTAPLTLVGHSAGGGFALRVAGSPIQNLFARTVLLAPYLGYNAPTNRPNSGGWASADIPRFIGLAMLRSIGIDCCGSLPTLAFAVPPNSEKDPGTGL